MLFVPRRCSSMFGLQKFGDEPLQLGNFLAEHTMLAALATSLAGRRDSKRAILERDTTEECGMIDKPRVNNHQPK